MLKDEIVKLLEAEGEGYLSGQRISAQLGVSRAAVWKAIEALRKEGYEIDSRSNCGYRLVRIRLPVPAHGCRGGYAAGYFGGGGGIHRAGAGAGGAAPGGDPAAAKGRKTGKISI